MRIENKSLYHPTSKVAPLVDFVADRSKYGALATVRLVDSKSPKKVTGGWAEKQRLDVGELSLVAPSLITMELSRANAYPRISEHVPEVGPIVLNSWEEEFVLVLAHEDRHITQAWQNTKFSNEHAAEVDAEKTAVRVLKQFRRTIS